MVDKDYICFLDDNDPELDDMLTFNISTNLDDELIGKITFELIDVQSDFCNDVSEDTIYECTDGEEQYLYIQTVFISRDYRYKGYGNDLMKEFIMHMTEEFGINTIILFPDPIDNDLGIDNFTYKNLLVKFYERFGFKFIEDSSFYMYYQKQ